jgi:hypothetical protein
MDGYLTFLPSSSPFMFRRIMDFWVIFPRRLLFTGLLLWIVPGI